MRVSLLNFLCCPTCRAELACIEHSSTVEIQQGILVCGGCGRWYPVLDFIPELLPDNLRDWDREIAFLEAFSGQIPDEKMKGLLEKSRQLQKTSVPTPSEGRFYKKAEMSIEERVEDPDFFGPGLYSPFNRYRPEYTVELIRRFSLLMPLMGLKRKDVVLDVGSGYSWTTEWLLKAGYESIGVDICRTYLEKGKKRMGDSCPHLVIADVENLPIKDSVLNGILCFDAFHHIYDRKKAFSLFFRTLRKGCSVILAEPGKDHESLEESIDVMEKYGILEKGMELSDIRSYIQDEDFLPPEQHYVLKLKKEELKSYLDHSFARTHSYVDCLIFSVTKSGERDYFSTSPNLCCAEITPDFPPPVILDGRKENVLSFQVTNTGDTIWKHKTPEKNGEVRLGGFLSDKDDVKLVDIPKANLEKDVYPRETIKLDLVLPEAQEPGSYFLQVDLENEGFGWFHTRGGKKFRFNIIFQH